MDTDTQQTFSGNAQEYLEGGVATQEQPAVQAQPLVINISNDSVNMNTNTQVAAAGVGAGISPKSKMVTLLLCIFIGYFGAHYFYVGRTASGLLRLVTFNFFAIGWIYDIVMILMNNFRDNFGLRVCQ